MNCVKDKYGGTTTYFLVLVELVRAAQYRGSQDIALIMGLPTTGAHMGKEMGQILGEISEDEITAGRPMLSAVAVGVNGTPGPGFFTLARDLDLIYPSEDETSFWQRQQEAAYEAWKRQLPKSSKTALTL